MSHILKINSAQKIQTVGIGKLLACSRLSDGGTGAKHKSERKSGIKSPNLSLPIFFARTPLSERLEQASK